jgi:predicted HNH restriction endonuclease
VVVVPAMSAKDESPKSPKLLKRWRYSEADKDLIANYAKTHNNEDTKWHFRETLGCNLSAHYVGRLRRERRIQLEVGDVLVTDDGRSNRPVKREKDHILNSSPEVPSERLEEKVRAIRDVGLSEKPEGVLNPELVSSTSKQHKRDPQVIAWVEGRANGRCDLCDSEAPFVRSDGSKFLEVHHVIPLSEHGADIPDNAAALCPNCHRRCHHGFDRVEVTAKLQKKLRKRYQ